MGLHALIYFPSQQHTDIQLPVKLNAEDLRDIALSHVSIPRQHRDMFAFVYKDAKNRECWLADEKTVVNCNIPQCFRQIKLQMRLLLYPPQLVAISHEATRGVLHWQLWRDLCEGRLRCDKDTFQLLAAQHILLTSADELTVPAKEMDVSYFLDQANHLELPQWLFHNAFLSSRAVLDGVKECIRQMYSLHRPEILMNFLRIAQHLPLYGQHNYEGLFHNGKSECTICIGPEGVRVFNCSFQQLAVTSLIHFYQPNDCTNICWNEMKTISMHRTKLSIHYSRRTNVKSTMSRSIVRLKNLPKQMHIEFPASKVAKQCVFVLQKYMRSMNKRNSGECADLAVISGSMDSGYSDIQRCRTQSFSRLDSSSVCASDEQQSMLRSHSNPLLCTEQCIEECQSHRLSVCSSTSGAEQLNSSNLTQLMERMQDLRQQIIWREEALTQLERMEQEILNEHRIDTLSNSDTDNTNNSILLCNSSTSDASSSLSLSINDLDNGMSSFTSSASCRLLWKQACPRSTPLKPSCGSTAALSSSVTVLRARQLPTKNRRHPVSGILSSSSLVCTTACPQLCSTPIVVRRPAYSSSTVSQSLKPT